MAQLVSAHSLSGLYKVEDNSISFSIDPTDTASTTFVDLLHEVDRCPKKPKKCTIRCTQLKGNRYPASETNLLRHSPQRFA